MGNRREGVRKCSPGFSVFALVAEFVLGNFGGPWRTWGMLKTLVFGKWCSLPGVTLKTSTHDVPVNPGVNLLVSQLVLEQ